MNLQLPIIFFFNELFQTCIIVKRTCISIFSKIGLVDQSKLCTQIYLQKFANCINLQLAIRISKNNAFRTCTTPSRTFRPILRSIGPLDKELPQKEIISTDRQTDGRCKIIVYLLQCIRKVTSHESQSGSRKFNLREPHFCYGSHI